MPGSAYDVHAAGYAQRLDPSLAGQTERVVELANPRLGVRLLDLATGTGTIARAAAGRGAEVIGLDASPEMLEIARRLAPGVELTVGDAAALPFASGSFDVVTCGLSLSHFPEPVPALAEVRRVLTQGGIFVASAWGSGTNPASIVGGLLDRLAPPLRTIDERTWSDVRQGCAMLRRAGFEDVAALSERFDASFPTAEEALAWALAWPLLAARVGSLDSAARGGIVLEARRALDATGLAFRLSFVFYTARRRDAA